MKKILVGQELQAAFDRIGMRNRDHFSLIGNMNHYRTSVAFSLGWDLGVYDKAYQFLRKEMNPYLSEVQKEILDSDPPQYATGAV